MANHEPRTKNLLALDFAAGDDPRRRLRAGVPQLFRLLRQLQVLRAATLAVCALRGLRLPLVRRIEAPVRRATAGTDTDAENRTGAHAGRPPHSVDLRADAA